MIGILEGFPKDLREMDEDQFKRMFELVRRETKNWIEFKPELLVENNQFLLIIRCSLELSQRELANKLGTTKDWIRSIERGKNVIQHLTIAKRWTSKIENMMKNSNIELLNSLSFFKNFQFAREIAPKKTQKFSPMSKLTEVELKSRFKKLRNKTNNFTIIDPKILVEDPQSILIFRLVSGLSQREFSRRIGKSFRHLRSWEILDMHIKLSNASKITSKIQGIINQVQDKSLEQTTRNFRFLKESSGHRKLNSMIRSGLIAAKNQKPSKLEKKIIKLLTNKKFELHAIVNGFKRDINVDFAIPNSENPFLVIETFDFSIKNKNVSHCKLRVRETDHKFQMIKLRNPNLKTMMIIRLNNGKLWDLGQAKELIETELLNTDHLIVNNLEEITNFIR